MTVLVQLHDRLAAVGGLDCRCDLWGPPRCPAMQAAIEQRRRETSPTSQLELGDHPPAGQMQADEAWPEGF